MSILALSAALLATAGDPAAAAKQQSAAPQKKICRTMAMTGSRLSRKRVCATTEQWNAHDAAAQDENSEISKNPRWRAPSEAPSVSPGN